MGVWVSMLRAIYIDLRKYPFLGRLDDVLARLWPGLNIADLISSRTGLIYEKALSSLRHILETGRAPRPCSTSEDEVLVFYSVLFLASLSSSRWVIDRVALAYSKRASEYLVQDSPESIVEVARRLGIEAKYIIDGAPRIPVGIRRSSIVYRTLPYAMSLKDYVRYSRRLSGDPKYALSNQILDRGWVYMDKKVFTRILEEAIANHIRSMVKPLGEIPSQLKELADELKGMMKEYMGSGKSRSEVQSASVERSFEEIKGVIDYEAFPQCIKTLIDDLKRGENLSHHARFTLAAFLSRIGMDVEDILELFKNTPDFNERIARYQIEHIAGLRGSRKQYMPYSCQTMKSLGLCPLTDGDCGVKNPLVLYYRNLRRKYRGKNRSGKRAEK